MFQAAFNLLYVSLCSNPKHKNLKTLFPQNILMIFLLLQNWLLVKIYIISHILIIMFRDNKTISKNKFNVYYTFVCILLFQPPLLMSQKGLSQGSKMLHVLLTDKNIRIPTQTKIRRPPYPCTMTVVGGQGGIFKSCPRVLKLWI